MSDDIAKWVESEEFNGIAYSYRSWPGYDPPGVVERFEELKRAIVEHAARLTRRLEVREAQLAQCQARGEIILKQLVSIHSLLHANDVVLDDGRTMRFDPPEKLAKEAWRLISERIREIPAVLASAAQETNK